MLEVAITCLKSQSMGAFTWSPLRWFQSVVVQTKKVEFRIASDCTCFDLLTGKCSGWACPQTPLNFSFSIKSVPMPGDWIKMKHAKSYVKLLWM